MRSPSDAEDGFLLRIERSMAGLRQVGAWVDAVSAALGLERGAEYALRLCLEEAAANVVMHGAASGGGAADTVTLRVTPEPDTLCVTVEDCCRAFDPLDALPPERPKSLQEARVGGLGIHLMRRYATSISYRRIGDLNRLTLRLERPRA